MPKYNIYMGNIMNVEKVENKFVFGFVANPKQKILNYIAHFIVTVLRLNNNSYLSNQIIQSLNPIGRASIKGAELLFRTGHNRLKWRADTFSTEEPLMIKWLSNFSDNDVFLDVGANVGTYSIPAAKLGATVLSLELDPANNYILHSNTVINDLCDKITILPFAAGNANGVEKIYYRDFSVGDALQSVGRDQILPTKKNNPFTIKQLILTIDDIFSIFDLPSPNKIKIDVDGNEEFVFEGAKKTISNAREIYFEDNGLDSDKLILEEFVKMGFSIKDEAPCDVGVVKNVYGRNLLLVK